MNNAADAHPQPKTRTGRTRYSSLLHSRQFAATIAAGVIAFGALTAAFAWGNHAVLRLDLSFSRNACCDMAIWLNDQTHHGPAAVLNIEGGHQATYSIPVNSPKINRLRIDFGSVPGSTMTVRGVSVTSGGKTLDTLPLSRIAGFAALRAVERPAQGGIVFRATNTTPSIDQFVLLSTHRSALQAALAKVTAEPVTAFVAILVFATLLAAMVTVTTRRHALVMLAALGLTALALRAIPHFLWRLHFSSDVTGAVGQSSYLGFPKSREQAELALTALAAIVVPAATALLWRRGRDSHLPTFARPDQPVPLRRIWLLPVPILILLGLFFVPDLRAQLQSLQQLSYPTGWDTTNLVFWQFLFAKGLTPIKDFYFPYGLQYLFTYRPPWGTLIDYASYMAFWGYIVVGTFLAVGRFFTGRAHLLRFCFLMSVLLLAVIAGMVPLEFRYGGSLGVVLLFASIDEATGLLAPRRFLFAIAFMHLVLFEVAQAIYALPGLAVIAAITAFDVSARGRGPLARWATSLGATVAVPSAAAVFGLAAIHLLGGTIRLYEQLGAVAAGVAFVGSIDPWITHPTNLAGAILWASAITLALGVWEILTSATSLRQAYGLVVAIGLLDFMLLQKQVLRQGIESQIWFSIAYGLALWVALTVRAAQLRHRVIAAALLGALVALTLTAGELHTGLWTLLRGPTRFGRSINALVTEQRAFGAADRARFAPFRFSAYHGERAVAAALRHDSAPGSPGRLWVMGDDVAVEMLLGRTTPYYYNTFWEMAPVAWQRFLVGQLNARPPAHAVWNPQETSFDAVPQIVRAPLIFEWAVQHLVPDRTVAPFEILRPRRSNEAIPLAWWRERLGSTLDLGHIPEAVDLPRATCRAGDRCGSFLVVTPQPGNSTPTAFHVPLTVDGLSFDITFAGSAGADRYVVPLDRLWFWNSASSPAATSVRQGLIGGGRVTVVRRRFDPDTLY